MPSRDTYHSLARKALIADGWTITHDPYLLTVGRHNLYVDLGAEAPIAAERAGRRIAVEVRSFLSASPVTDLERAIGQFVLYRAILDENDPDRALYLAVPDAAYDEVFDDPLGRLTIASQHLRMIVLDSEKEVIARWIEPPSTANL